VTESAGALARISRPNVDELLDATPNLVALFDDSDRLLYANEAFRNAYGMASGSEGSWNSIIRNAHARACGPVIDTNDIDDWLTRANTRRGTRPFRSFEVDLHDGRWFLITETMQDGTLLLVGVEITAIKIDSRALRGQRDRALRAALTDPLTGLANRRYCLEQLEEWRQRSSREASGALAIIDLDGFKAINDTYGHDFGDRVLVHFARLVLQHVRLQDLFGRIGGEEFLLFLPECHLEAARNVLNDLLADLTRQVAIKELPNFRYSFSAGLIMITSCESIEHSVSTADKLLYSAKQGGRARVVDAGSSR
jgi:diguanylate cyclase (GGDEF)-like protein